MLRNDHSLGLGGRICPNLAILATLTDSDREVELPRVEAEAAGIYNGSFLSLVLVVTNICEGSCFLFLEPSANIGSKSDVRSRYI